MKRTLELSKDAGIHTNLETAGTFSWEKWEQTLRMLDLIYFDLKILDRDLHERHLGAGFDRIMENAQNLAAQRFPVEFRMAMIPANSEGPSRSGASRCSTGPSGTLDDRGAKPVCLRRVMSSARSFSRRQR